MEPSSSDPQFDAPRTGTGTHEWSEHGFNIQRGCPSNCGYCYSAANAQRFRLRDRDDWAREELTRNAFIDRYPRRAGVIMTPTAHDITPFNVDAFIRVTTLMLEAGNRLLIVSKPHLECVRKMVVAYQKYRAFILFRFTIGTTDSAIAAHWEPGAPQPAERLASLRLAHDSGYQTSISSEPLLGGLDTARCVLDAVRPWTTDTVWIGLMNRIRSRVDMSVPANAAHVEAIERAQSDVEVMRMVAALKADPLVRWKDSIGKVIARCGAGHARP